MTPRRMQKSINAIAELGSNCPFEQALYDLPKIHQPERIGFSISSVCARCDGREASLCIRGRWSLSVSRRAPFPLLPYNCTGQTIYVQHKSDHEQYVVGRTHVLFVSDRRGIQSIALFVTGQS